MAIESKPFYWKSRKAWYLHVIGKNGKRSARKLADKRKEAFEEYQKLIDLANSTAEAARTNDPLFETVSDAWLERQGRRLEQGQVSAKWLVRACGTVDRFKAANPTIRVSEMTPAKVQSWLVNPAANYERTELTLLKQVLRWACVQAKLIEANPLDALELPQMTSRKVTLSAVEHGKVMEHAKHLRPLLEVAYLTGCRPGELRQLQWDHIADDMSEAVLVIHKTAKRTGRIRRLIFSTQAQEILCKQKKVSDYVFLNSRGRSWTSNAVVQAVQKIRKASGVSLVAGTYRHTYATNALDKGIPIATVSQLLGHTSTAMVSRVYGHLAERVDHLKNAAQIISAEPSPEHSAKPSKASAPKAKRGKAQG